MSEVYDFSESIQKKIVAMLLFEKGVYTRHRDIINPHHFENPTLRGFVTIIEKFYKEYSRVPSLDEFSEELLSFLGENSRLPEEEYFKLLQSLPDLAAEEFEYARDKMIRFVKNQEVKQAILKSVDLLKQQDFGSIWKLIEKARLIGENTEDLGLDYFDSTDERIDHREAGINQWSVRIPTMLGALDNLMGGGLPIPRAGMVMASAKRGKTVMLTHLGASAIIGGFNVLHVFFEGATEEGMADYYDVKFSGLSFTQLKGASKELRESIIQWREKSCGQLIIKHFPANTCSAWTVESLIHQLKAVKDFEPELLILDYLGLMIPSEKRIKYDSRYEQQGQISKEIVSLGQRNAFGTWLGHQTRRASFTKVKTDMQDSADSIEPIRHLDIITTINQSEDEESQKMMRFFVAGSRFCPDRKTLKFGFDKERVHVFDLEENA